MAALFIFIVGLAVGAITWAATPLLSGQFEPFDSGLAMWFGQALMSAYGGYIGFRHNFWKLLLAILGMYLGQVAYWYVFGSSEARAWILLGAFSTLLLCALPFASGVAGILSRRLRKAKSGNC